MSRQLLQRAGRLVRQARRRAELARGRAMGSGFDRYRDDPVGYCRDILRVDLTPTQEQIAKLLTTPPYKVLVKAGHKVGKSFLAACLVNWWFDVNSPGVALTTAPTDRQVKDILWKEVRVIRRRAGLGGFPGPKVPRLESAPDHFAYGFTAREGEHFQGQHSLATLIVFDEAEGVEPIFWEAAEPMLGGQRYAFLGIYNPTLQSGPTADAERSGDYRVVTMSTLDHPNIAAQLRDEPPPFPSAIQLGRLKEMLAKWSQVVPEPGPGLVTLDGVHYRPGAVAQARLLGVRPSTAFNAVWSEWVFETAARQALPRCGPLQIGCDPAWQGDDDTAIHVRQGGVSLYHETYHGQDTVWTAGRLKELATQWGEAVGMPARNVPLVVDVIGLGAGVHNVLSADGWNVVGVNVLWPVEGWEEEYPNLRSALWFGLAEEAAAGNVSFAGLPSQALSDLRRELTAPLYTLDSRGRRVVEGKDKTKARLNRSPDNADAVLLAYCAIDTLPDRVVGRVVA